MRLFAKGAALTERLVAADALIGSKNAYLIWPARRVLISVPE